MTGIRGHHADRVFFDETKDWPIPASKPSGIAWPKLELAPATYHFGPARGARDRVDLRLARSSTLARSRGTAAHGVDLGRRLKVGDYYEPSSDREHRFVQAELVARRLTLVSIPGHRFRVGTLPLFSEWNHRVDSLLFAYVAFAPAGIRKPTIVDVATSA